MRVFFVSQLFWILVIPSQFTLAEAPSIVSALVQYEIKGSRTRKEVLEAMSGWVNSAKAKGAELVVFPEFAVLDMWPKVKEGEAEKKALAKIARDNVPVLLKEIEKLAAKLNIHILPGSVPNFRNGKIYNTAYLFGPWGKVFEQDKVYLTKWEKDIGMAHGQNIKVFSSPWGKLAILICYDVEFPLLSQQLVKSEPEILIVPSMTESRQGLSRVRWAAQARAIEHHAFVLVSGTIGKPSSDWEHFGQSVFLSPQEGTFSGVLKEAREGRKELIVQTLDLKALRESRKKSSFYPAKDQLAR